MTPITPEAGLPNELRILLACLRPPDSENLSTVPLLLDEQIDWEYLWDMASWHGVLPFLARSLARENRVPAEFRERLQAAAFQIAARNLHLASVVAKVSSALESASIPLISYKG